MNLDRRIRPTVSDEFANALFRLERGRESTDEPGTKRVATVWRQLPMSICQYTLKESNRAAVQRLSPHCGDIRIPASAAMTLGKGVANTALATLYWQIGTRIRQGVLQARRAQYGAEIVAALRRQLEARFGRGFGEKNLRKMVQFAETFPGSEIVAALLRQLS